VLTSLDETGEKEGAETHSGFDMGPGRSRAFDDSKWSAGQVMRKPWSRSCLDKQSRYWHRSIRSQQASLDLLAAQPSIPRDRGCSVSHPLATVSGSPTLLTETELFGSGEPATRHPRRSVETIAPL
jgi:hypothetical protein